MLGPWDDLIQLLLDSCLLRRVVASTKREQARGETAEISPRYRRETAERPPRYRREAAERPPRGRRETAEIVARCDFGVKL